MRLGKIVSQVGNQAVVKVSDPKKLPEIGCSVSISKNQYIGKVSDVIGRVDSPYLVVKFNRNIKNLPHDLIGKTMSFVK